MQVQIREVKDQDTALKSIDEEFEQRAITKASKSVFSPAPRVYLTNSLAHYSII